MLGTKDLTPSRVGGDDIQGFDPDKPQDLLVLGGTQILGAAAIEIGPAKRDKVSLTLSDCWGVTDMTEGHWAALLGRGADFLAVPRGVADATRLTLERYHADGIRRIQSSEDRRAGVIDAVRAISGTFQTATLQAAAAVGQSRGGQGGGPR